MLSFLSLPLLFLLIFEYFSQIYANSLSKKEHFTKSIFHFLK